MAISFPRDDLRTRSGAAGSPHGGYGAESRERREDGADDHPSKHTAQTRESVRERAEHSLAAAQPHAERCA